MKTGICLILLLLAWPYPLAAQEPSTKLYSFKCGGAQVAVSSTCMFKYITQCTNQSLVLTTPQGNSVKLPHDGKASLQRSEGPPPLMDALVSDWTCAIAKDGTPYILLWYICRWGKDCQDDTMEWVRIFNVQGKNMTAHLKRLDANGVLRLYKKLGLDLKTSRVDRVEY